MSGGPPARAAVRGVSCALDWRHLPPSRLPAGQSVPRVGYARASMGWVVGFKDRPRGTVTLRGMRSGELRPHLDQINRFYDRVMADGPMMRHEAMAVYRAATLAQGNMDAVDRPLRPVLAEVTSTCKSKLKRRLATGSHLTT